MHINRFAAVATLTALLLGLPLTRDCHSATQEGASSFKATDMLVSGTGEVVVKSDTVYISLGVRTRGTEAADTARKNADKTDGVIKAITANGVPEEDVKTEEYSVDTVEQEVNGKETFKGYEVSNTVRITVRAVSKAGQVLDAALKAGANTVNGVSFGLADPRKAQEEALAKAIADATRKAKVAAKAANLGAIRLLQLRVGGGYDTDYYLPGYAAPATPIKDGRQTVRATVSARFGVVGPAPIITP